MILKIEQKYKEILTNDINSSLLLLIAVVLLVIKIAGDFLFYTLSDVYSFYSVTWRIILSVFLLLIIAVIFIKNYLDSLKDVEQTSTAAYLREISYIDINIRNVVLEFFYS